MKQPTKIDRHIGKKIREIRLKRGMSQTYLAKKAKLSFQQIQKYENGKNRIAASRLFKIAKILETPLLAFFP